MNPKEKATELNTNFGENALLVADTIISAFESVLDDYISVPNWWGGHTRMITYWKTVKSDLEDNLKKDEDGLYVNAPNYLEVKAFLNAHYESVRKDKTFMPFVEKLKKLFKK